MFLKTIENYYGEVTIRCRDRGREVTEEMIAIVF